MLYSYAECIEMFGTDRKLKQALVHKQIYKIEKGVYSDREFEPELAVISMKYSKFIFSLNSAFYYHGLTDVIPDLYYLATPSEAKTIRDKRVVQKYENSDGFNLGVSKVVYNTVEIKIYDKERMLVELIRNKKKFPFDYYKEILLKYRTIINELDIRAIQEYAYALPKTNMVLEIFQMEVL